MIEIRKLSKANETDFYTIHEASECSSCYCTAWWYDDWEEYKNSNSTQNKNLRKNLISSGIQDGYILYVDGTPAGWCQVTPRDTLKKIVSQFERPAEELVYAITCFLILAPYRKKGYAQMMLEKITDTLKEEGICALEAFPRSGNVSDPMELWTGPEKMYQNAGFKKISDHPVYRFDFERSVCV